MIVSTIILTFPHLTVQLKLTFSTAQQRKEFIISARQSGITTGRFWALLFWFVLLPGPRTSPGTFLARAARRSRLPSFTRVTRNLTYEVRARVSARFVPRNRVTTRSLRRRVRADSTGGGRAFPRALVERYTHLSPGRASDSTSWRPAGEWVGVEGGKEFLFVPLLLVCCSARCVVTTFHVELLATTTTRTTRHGRNVCIARPYLTH